MTDLIVAVPAREEEIDLASCLANILVAAATARERGLVERVTVCVSAHRCTDRTYEVAIRSLATHPWVGGLVIQDDTSDTVGQVRHHLLQQAVVALSNGRPGLESAAAEDTWLFTTDADSFVPAEWICATLDQAGRLGAVAAAGLVAEEDWQTPVSAQDAFRVLLSDSPGPRRHEHVYGANLAVRLDAYLDVGGFRAFSHGEDRDLFARLRLGGHPVAALLRPVVLTSARYPGRRPVPTGQVLGQLAVAAHGLGLPPSDPPMVGQEAVLDTP